MLTVMTIWAQWDAQKKHHQKQIITHCKLGHDWPLKSPKFWPMRNLVHVDAVQNNIKLKSIYIMSLLMNDIIILTERHKCSDKKTKMGCGGWRTFQIRKSFVWKLIPPSPNQNEFHIWILKTLHSSSSKWVLGCKDDMEKREAKASIKINNWIRPMQCWPTNYP